MKDNPGLDKYQAGDSVSYDLVWDDRKGKFKGKGGKSGGKVQGFNAMQMFLRVKDLRSRLLAGLVRIDEVLDDMDVLEGELEAMV